MLRKNIKQNGKKIADKNWILTAYDESANDSNSAITAINQGKAAPATDKSADKGTTNSGTLQENVQKNAQSLAQNGESVKKSLTPAQDNQVHSDNFKKWFGDWEKDPENASKVVDEEGIPLVVFHGSDRDFNVFSTDEGVMRYLLDTNVLISMFKNKLQIYSH